MLRRHRNPSTLGDRQHPTVLPGPTQAVTNVRRSDAEQRSDLVGRHEPLAPSDEVVGQFCGSYRLARHGRRVSNEISIHAFDCLTIIGRQACGCSTELDVLVDRLEGARSTLGSKEQPQGSSGPRRPARVRRQIAVEIERVLGRRSRGAKPSSRSSPPRRLRS